MATLSPTHQLNDGLSKWWFPNSGSAWRETVANGLIENWVPSRDGGQSVITTGQVLIPNWDPTPPWTLSILFRWISGSSRWRVLGYAGGGTSAEVALDIENGNSITVFVDTSTGRKQVSGGAYTTGQWHQLTVACGANLAAYLDGAQIGSTSMSGDVVTNPAYGLMASVLGETTVNQIGEISLINRELSRVEAAAYSVYAKDKYTGMIAYGGTRQLLYSPHLLGSFP